MFCKGSRIDRVNSNIDRETCESKSQDLLKPSNLWSIGILILFMNGDHKKFNATIKDETVIKPNVSLLTPAESSHRPNGIPRAKVGIAADIPRKIKLNCDKLVFI